MEGCPTMLEMSQSGRQTLGNTLYTVERRIGPDTFGRHLSNSSPAIRRHIEARQTDLSEGRYRKEDK
jgi:hypothetical protein